MNHVDVVVFARARPCILHVRTDMSKPLKVVNFPKRPST